MKNNTYLFYEIHVWDECKTLKNYDVATGPSAEAAFFNYIHQINMSRAGAKAWSDIIDITLMTKIEKNTWLFDDSYFKCVELPEAMLYDGIMISYY